ncbi:hypothetical protein [Lentzea sp. CA-135723]|uniref:hypothetical protein n=1 Tax=Lentzea sp. CA-135723 TaxID=3239950 RepID=UPI003D9145A8
MRPLLEYRAADWTVAVAGVVAFGLGVLGLVDQDSQLSAVGLDPAAHPAADPLRRAGGRVPPGALWWDRRRSARGGR